MNIPDEYAITITRFIARHAEWIEYQIQALDSEANFHPIPPETLAGCGLARQLYYIAQAAADDLPRHPDETHEEHILDTVADLVARLYYTPGIGTTDDVDVPAVFWQHPLGKMCARALLWALEGELITLQEAADTARVSVQAISQAVSAGRIAGYVDPDASERQGRTLVKRVDVQNTQWKRLSLTSATNRYRNPAKRAAYETATAFTFNNILGPHIFPELVELLQEQHDLTEANARDVAAKAIRVERGRRRKLAIEESRADRRDDD